MQICEEYHKRYKLEVPFIKHNPMSYLFIRDSSEQFVDWKVFHIVWNSPSGHPGCYVFRQLKPVRNSHGSGTRSRYYCDFLNYLKFIEEKKDTVHWDEYDSFILKLLNNLDKDKIIKDKKTLTLTAWEMFIFANDSFFANHYNNDLLFGSLNYSLPIKDRYAFYQKFLETTDVNQEPFFSWKTDLMKLLKTFPTWLMNLLD